MSDTELPPLWALDKAAKPLGRAWSGPEYYSGALTPICVSIIAHARTIAQYEQPPVDEDEASLKRILIEWMEWVDEADFKPWEKQFRAALAQFKRELETRK